MARQIGAALVIEIHGQKGGVVGHVHVAEAVVELDAVVDLQRAGREMNVLQMQVPVAVEDASLPEARGKEPAVPGVKPVGVEGQGGRCRGRKGVADELTGLAEILVGADAEMVDAAPVADFPGRLLGLVKVASGIARSGSGRARPRFRSTSWSRKNGRPRDACIFTAYSTTGPSWPNAKRPLRFEMGTTPR